MIAGCLMFPYEKRWVDDILAKQTALVVAALSTLCDRYITAWCATAMQLTDGLLMLNSCRVLSACQLGDARPFSALLPRSDDRSLAAYRSPEKQDSCSGHAVECPHSAGRLASVSVGDPVVCWWWTRRLPGWFPSVGLC